MSINNEINELVNAYNLLVRGIDTEADHVESRAYGGVVRAGKGKLVESIAKNLIIYCWKDLGGDHNRIKISSQKIHIPIKINYFDKLKNKDVVKYIKENIKDFFYGLKVDVHVFIDNKFVIGIECKAYTENAMLKRILVDFTLLKETFPNLDCFLFQLESQLGGDYSQIFKEVTYGSPSTHTLLSYFNVDLNIITLLEGERKVDEPIHDSEFYKELKLESLEKAAESFKNCIKKYL